MNTKLTLTIEQAVVEKAKRYARKKERSLSDLIENYLKALTNETTKETAKTSPIVKSLRGSFAMDKNADYKTELSKQLREKYL